MRKITLGRKRIKTILRLRVRAPGNPKHKDMASKKDIREITTGEKRCQWERRERRTEHVQNEKRYRISHHGAGHHSYTKVLALNTFSKVFKFYSLLSFAEGRETTKL